MKIQAAFLPPIYEKKHVQALQALFRGQAEEPQQGMLLKWIIEELCKTHNMSYRAGDTHETAFAEGRRFVGLELIRLIKTPMNKLFP